MKITKFRSLKDLLFILSQNYGFCFEKVDFKQVFSAPNLYRHGIGIEGNTGPSRFFAPIWELLLKIVLLGEGELELSSEHREKLLDLTVNFLNSCKAVEADDLEGIDKACMKSIDVCCYSL